MESKSFSAQKMSNIGNSNKSEISVLFSDSILLLVAVNVYHVKVRNLFRCFSSFSSTTMARVTVWTIMLSWTMRQEYIQKFATTI